MKKTNKDWTNRPVSVDIQAKRWFDGVNGNTYHSVRVCIDGSEIGSVPFAYGYERQYEQTALDLINAHFASSLKINDIFHSMYRNKFIKLAVNVHDVKRRKDL